MMTLHKYTEQVWSCQSECLKRYFENQTHFKGVLKAQFWPMVPAKYYLQKEPKAWHMF